MSGLVQNVRQMRGLENRFHFLCSKIGRAAPDIFVTLMAAYQRSLRAYHNLDHISACLDEFDAPHQQSDDPDAIEAAIWFHDAVYDPRRSDNEQQSADMARRLLARCGASAAFCDRVETLILVTRHDQLPQARDGRLIADIDLAILGKPPAVFDVYEQAIRKEYRHVSDEAFRAGRVKVLRRFLDRPRVYFTDDFFNRYETTARQNLQRSIALLLKTA